MLCKAHCFSLHDGQARSCLSISCAAYIKLLARDCSHLHQAARGAPVCCSQSPERCNCCSCDVVSAQGCSCLEVCSVQGAACCRLLLLCDKERKERLSIAPSLQLSNQLPHTSLWKSNKPQITSPRACLSLRVCRVHRAAGCRLFLLCNRLR